MDLNQIEVISKLFYGDNFKQWFLTLSYEERVNRMMAEDLERFRSCEKKSEELGIHRDYDMFTGFMQG